MAYFADHISEFLSLVFLVGLGLWILGGAVDSYDERKRLSKIYDRSAKEKSQTDLIQALLNAKRFEAAKKQAEAPIDKNGNYCHFDEATGKYLQKDKNGTLREYRP
jgi:hypothetical protein